MRWRWFVPLSALLVVAIVQNAHAQSINAAVQTAAADADSIKTGMLTIMGVIVVVSIAWAVISGIRK